MNILVVIPLILCVVQANAADKQDVKAKPTSSPANTIQQNPKYEMVYQPVKLQQPLQQLQYQPLQQLQAYNFPQLQQKAQYVPIQLIPKPYYVPQSQSAQPAQPTHAMIIIAQPALLPQSLIYGSQTQQLLNYFHSNPQAKYQLLQGNYQPQSQVSAQSQHAQTIQPTATYMQPVLATPVNNYLFSPQIQNQPQYVASPAPTPAVQLQYTTQQPQVQQSQPQYSALAQQQPSQYSLPQQAQPQYSSLTQQAQQQPQYSSLNHLAQLAAQQYLTSQMKSAPAIVTGFEHFTPEQQAQIKAQLSTHLGSNFHAVQSSNPTQYSSKYAAEQQQQQDFVPSPQVKSESVTTVSSAVAELLKSRFGAKTKN